MPPTHPSLTLEPARPFQRISRRLAAIAVILTSAVTLHAAIPGAPAWGTPSTTSSSTQVTLNWQAASGSPTSPYTVTGLNNFQSYQFQVAAVNSSGTTWGTFWHARPRPLIHTSGLHIDNGTHVASSVARLHVHRDRLGLLRGRSRPRDRHRRRWLAPMHHERPDGPHRF